MPGFTNTLIGLGPFVNADCCVVFTKNAVTVYNRTSNIILSRWRDTTGPRLWHFPLKTVLKHKARSPPPGVLPPSSPPIINKEIPTPTRLSQLDAIATLRQLITTPSPLAMATPSDTTSTVTSKPKPTTTNPRKLHLPSIPALVAFYHACLGHPIKYMWLDAIRAGNCNTFEGLTYRNVA